MRIVHREATHPTRATAVGYYVRQVLALAFVLGSFCYAAVIYFGEVDAGGGPWKTGDWLINYGGGFVRRGLFGSLLLGLHLPATWTLWLLYLIQTACYAILVAYLVWFLHRERYSWWAIALTCSPAAIPFIAYDPAGGYRKEILAFVPLVLLAWVVRAAKPRKWQVYTVGGLALLTYGLAVFSWEASAFVLPMVLYLVWRLRQKLAPRSLLPIFLLAGASALAVGGLAASVVAHGDADTVLAIKSALGARGLPSWQGGSSAIDALSSSGDESLSAVARRFPLYLVYVPMMLMALLPIVFSDWWRGNRLWGLAFIAGVIPLFVVVVDYGRWISMLALGCAVCISTRDSGPVATRWRALTTLPMILLWCMPFWMPSETTYQAWYYVAPYLLRLLAGWAGWI
jgi:hypothetical protein